MARGRVPRIDHDEALDLYFRGMTDIEIAAMFGVSYQGVQNWRKKNNLPTLAKKPRKDNGTLEDVLKLRPSSPLYFACEDLDLTFYAEEVRQVMDDTATVLI